MFECSYTNISENDDDNDDDDDILVSLPLNFHEPKHKQKNR